MVNNVNWNELANDLESLLSGRRTGRYISNKYWGDSYGDDIEQIMAYVEHYIADDDIREKDIEYREMQTNEMKKLIQLLRANAPIKQILSITFLHES
jgi:hypothetical protein